MKNLKRIVFMVHSIVEKMRFFMMFFKFFSKHCCGIRNWFNEENVMQHQISSNGSASGCFSWIFHKERDTLKADGDTTRDYQAERDEIMRGLVLDVRHHVAQLEEVVKAIADFLLRFECTLNTIHGVSNTIVAKLLSEIGDIRRFPNADKPANFVGIAPVNFSFAGKGDNKPSKQKNRRLQVTIILISGMLINIIYGMLKKRPSMLY